MDRRMGIVELVLTLAAVGQIILAFVLYDAEGDAWRINLGWGVLMISALFGWWPVLTFRRRGGVRGRGYTETTVLVDSGLYSIVRHPQYLAGVLMNIALTLITPHWGVAILGGVTAATLYWSAVDEERGCLEKFGQAYEQYMVQVPRMNFLLGIVRRLRRGKTGGI